jgi:hypothetical protein
VFFGGSLQGDVAIGAADFLRETKIVNARVLGTLYLSIGQGKPPIELKVLDLSATWDPQRGVAVFQRRVYDPQQRDTAVQSTLVSSSLILFHQRRFTPDEAHTYDLIDVSGDVVRLSAYRGDDPGGYSYVPRQVFGDEQALLELRMVDDFSLEVAALSPHGVSVERAVRTMDAQTYLM